MTTENGGSVQICGCTGTTVNINVLHLHARTCCCYQQYHVDFNVACPKYALYRTPSSSPLRSTSTLSGMTAVTN